MKLVRTQCRPDGIFGRMYNDNGVPQFYTLEHAYQQDDGSWLPKIAEGIYTCILGQHQLVGMAAPFQTYMISNVPDFMGNPVTNCLIHMGNFDRDSEGCILVGDSVVAQADGSQMVTNSVRTFEHFMLMQSGATEFTLEIQ